MKVLKIRNIFALVCAAFLVAGCQSTATPDRSSENPEVIIDDGQDANAGSIAEDDGLSEAELAEQQRLAEQQAREAEEQALREVRTFYFDFDKSTIKPDARPYLDAHAAYLQANPSQSVALNGYTDERGTKEYNVALGERRAKAVEDYLRFKGAAPSQMETVSFGEEFPAVRGSGEDVWAKNRRVVIEYK